MYRWNNNGGWNKTHAQIEETPRIDSFELALTQGWSWIMCGRKMIESCYVQGEETCDLLIGDALCPVEIRLSTKSNSYGGEQLFFLCPSCGQRFRFLYLAGETFLCRKCSRLNYKSQQETSSESMYYYHKGMELVDEHLQPCPFFRPDGFDFCRYLPDRPRYMHRTTYYRYLARFLRYRKRHEARLLEEMRLLLGPAAWQKITQGKE